MTSTPRQEHSFDVPVGDPAVERPRNHPVPLAARDALEVGLLQRLAFDAAARGIGIVTWGLLKLHGLKRLRGPAPRWGDPDTSDRTDPGRHMPALSRRAPTRTR